MISTESIFENPRSSPHSGFGFKQPPQIPLEVPEVAECEGGFVVVRPMDCFP